MKNYRSFSFLFYLLASSLFLVAEQKPTKIDHKLVDVIDGTSRVDIQKMLVIEQGIHHLLEGKKGEPLISYKGKYHTARALLKLEHSLKGNKDYNQRTQKTLKHAVDEAITLFEGYTADYMKEAQGWKTQTLKLITQWSKQVNRDDTLLLEWGNQKDGTEYEETRRMLPDFEHYVSFLEDLGTFMRDLRFSCKKSYKMFRESQREEL